MLDLVVNDVIYEDDNVEALAEYVGPEAGVVVVRLDLHLLALLLAVQLCRDAGVGVSLDVISSSVCAIFYYKVKCVYKILSCIV